MNNFKALSCILVTSSLGLAGCQQYLDRSDGVTSYAGNHLAANEAKMVVDPWPRNVDNTDIPADGQRMSDTVRKYKTAHENEEADDSPVQVFLGTQE